MSLSEVLTLLTAATSAVMAIINALKHGKTARKLNTTFDLTVETRATVRKVKSLVNGQSEALRRALEAAQERCQVLEAELTRLRGES